MAPAKPARPAAYPADIRSVQFKEETTLRRRPDADMKRESSKLGVVTAGTRVAVLGAEPASHGCKARWIEVAPRGWACESVLVPSTEAPTEATLPALTDDDAGVRPVKGVFGNVKKGAKIYRSIDDVRAGNGRVVDGSLQVRAAAAVDVDGVKFWRTTDGDLVDYSDVDRLEPSTWKGIAIAKGDKMPAWIHPTEAKRRRVTTYDASGRENGELPDRLVVHAFETAKKRVRVDDTHWVNDEEVRVAALLAPPAGVGPNERWFDVDLDQQVLVAYEGTRPVYATLVSTGKWGKHHTPAEIARIFAKHDTAHMNSKPDEEKSYSVADVPYTMFYDRGYALHGSYWHDEFGDVLSHGCVNIAPRDARLLYAWASPAMPAGWKSIYADAELPGSLVRIHSSRAPEPEVHGYAKDMLGAPR